MASLATTLQNFQKSNYQSLRIGARVIKSISGVLIKKFNFRAKPTPGSTLPGADTQSVNYKSDSKVELKKATVVSKSLNIKGLENESGLI
ncbi:unnamed protein product [Anisakis simplex]|uniref:Ovule protein n=1 Tax=Anisakis simplex TaxID=6269 RepID=A0A0M3KFY1_ANISI|nr:unnamed protein product [Anisakis simplex]